MEETRIKPNFDTVIFMLAAVFFVVSVFLVVDEKFLFKYGKKNYENLQIIGTMEKTTNDVRRRLSTDFVWFPSMQSENLYIGDSIFAGESSDAKISLMDGGELLLEEKSLIRLEKTTEQMILNLIAGSLSNTIGKGKSLHFKIGDQTHTITGDGVEIKLKRDEEGSLNITVKKGTAEITSTLGTQILKQTLTENQVLHSSANSLGFEIQNLTKVVMAPEKNQLALIQKIKPGISKKRFYRKRNIAAIETAVANEAGKAGRFTKTRKAWKTASINGDINVDETRGATKVVTPVATNEGWTIKVASYDNKDEAWNKVNELRVRGLSPYYTVTNKAGRMTFLVNIGLFGNKADADAFAVKLKSDLESQDKKPSYNLTVIKSD